MAAKLLEGVVKSGWEVVSSAEFTTTPGFELVTWVFKRSATPIGDGNGAVVALMLTPPNRSVRFDRLCVDYCTSGMFPEM